MNYIGLPLHRLTAQQALAHVPPLMMVRQYRGLCIFGLTDRTNRSCAPDAFKLCHNLPMCGRYRLSRRKQLVEEHFGSVSGEDDWTPRYNIAPTQPVPIILRGNRYC